MSDVVVIDHGGAQRPVVLFRLIARRRGLAMVVAATILVSACGGSSSGSTATRVSSNTTLVVASSTTVTAVDPPCGAAEGAVLELGSPTRTAPSERYAQFTTSGGAVWVTARDFSRGGIFDIGSRAAIYVGFLDEPPEYDERSGSVSNVQVQVSVVEDTWSRLTLEAGEYWLWTSKYAGYVAVESCEPGMLSNPVPVP